MGDPGAGGAKIPGKAALRLAAQKAGADLWGDEQPPRRPASAAGGNRLYRPGGKQAEAGIPAGRNKKISLRPGGRQLCGSGVRNLTPGELLGEVYEAQRQTGRKISSLVLMGIGEPLDNLQNVLTFLDILCSEEGQHLGYRHISLSTCGLIPGIRELMDKKLGLTLSISLHAPEDGARSAIMPVNRQYPIGELMEVCREYFAVTGRRISYEYALIDGVNDTPEQAAALARLLEGQICHVNLIPVNPVAERETRRSSRAAVERFARRLGERGVNATVRRELGSDISAACGQLRRRAAGVTPYPPPSGA